MIGSDTFLKAALDPAARLDDLLVLAGKRHPVAFETVSLGPFGLDILQITDLPGYIDHLVETAPAGARVELPFWAKLWPASFPLAVLASRLKPAPGDRLLEIGAGLGLCGLAAAKAGFDCLITDIAPEALLFIRASILRNGLEENARPGLLDLATDRPDGRFEVVLGSEALYLPALHEPLAGLLEQCLSNAPHAQALLSCDQCREAAPFFARANQGFAIQRSQSVCRSDSGQSQTCMLYRMRRRDHA